MGKLLFIRYKNPAKVTEGGELGTQMKLNVLIRLLGQENVDTYCIHDENKKRKLADYIKGVFWFPMGYFFGLTPKRVRQILAMSGHYDYIFIDRTVFGILAKRLKEYGYKGRVFCFFHNIEPVYFKAKLGNKPWRFLITRCADKNDRWSCRYADTIISLNTRDGKEIEKRYGRYPDSIMALALDDKYDKKDYPSEMTGKKPLCMCIAAYFKPNCDGIDWFIRNVYPHVDIKLRIVGKGMNKMAENYQIPSDVEIFSDVPDLVPYYEEADIMTIPVFQGSGMKIKTCESLMYGKNIIASDEPLEGYELDTDRMGARCNTAQEFIAAINSFIESPRPRFNKYSRSVFLDKYSTDSMMDAFRALLK